jgi:hypothetical protein
MLGMLLCRLKVASTGSEGMLHVLTTKVGSHARPGSSGFRRRGPAADVT